ncbi:MAG: SCO family protein [Pirellulales bacterium]
MSRGVMFWLAILMVFSGGVAIRYAQRGLQLSQAARNAKDHAPVQDAPEIPASPTMDRFELTDQRGQPFDSESLRGQVWVGSFFYASCPGACVLQNQRVQLLQTKFGPRGLKLVSITCDPDRDTPGQLDVYSRKFQADPQGWVFLTGKFDYIQQVGAKFFQVPVARETHGSHLILFDREGKVVGTFGASNAESFDRLNKLLDELLPATPATAPADAGGTAEAVGAAEAVGVGEE